MNTPNAKGAKPIQIFRPGRHVASDGAALDFSESHLQASAAAYDPAKHEAPIVIGHPKGNAPAYGWVGSLSFADGSLDATPQQVNPEFAELVAAGAFKKVSASFYSPDSPQNPVPGVFYLRHIGFLGAQPPAIKGLRAPEFAEGEEGVVEFADWSDVQNASLWRRMRDFIIAQFGLDKADSVIPDYAVASLEQDARSESPDESGIDQSASATSFSDPTHQEKTAVTPEAAAALEAENASLKTLIAAHANREKTAAAATRHADLASFAEGLVKEGKLLPAHKDVAIATLDFMTGQPDVVEFGEGEAKKPLADAFKEFLTAMPKLVDFREHAGGGKASDVKDDPTALAAKAVEFQEAEEKAGRTISIAQAVAHVAGPAED